MSENANEKASVTVKQLSLSDDSGGAVSRQVLAGDGSSAVAWPSGTSLAITYNRAGTFTPQVKLTDEFGNVGTVSLNPVTVSDDNAAPVVRVTRPAASMRERIAGWRVIRGTATDVGTGVDKVLVFVLQKRGGLWYVYHFRKRVWLKGRSTQAATLSHVKARPALLSTDSVGRWHTKWIRGLKTGKLVVHTAAFDQVLNIGLGPVVRQKITRR